MSLRLREPAVFLAVAIIGAAFLYYARQPVNHDVAWFFYAARGMLAGGTLYRDYIDINTPMAYLTLMPAALLARLPFLSNEAALAGCILIYVLAAYVLCVAVTRRMEIKRLPLEKLRGVLLAVMCFLPGYAFGQREHIFAILTLPYILATGLRGETRAPLPRRLAIAGGIAAAVAASIKPPFILVPLAVEIAVAMRRKGKIILTPDLAAFVAATAFIYAASFMAWPSYWTDILPWSVTLYAAYDNFRFLSTALLVLVPLFAVGLMTGDYRGKGGVIGARWALAAAALGAFGVFIVQRKGWPYHSVPALTFTCALVALNLTDLKEQAAINRLAATLRAGVGIAVLASAFVLATMNGNVDPDMMAGVEARIRQTDGSFYIMSTGNYPAFPLALNPAYKWASRFPQLIMLPGFAAAEARGEPLLRETWFRAAVLQDIQRAKPAIVFIYMPTDAGMPDNFDTLGWFRRDPAFEKEWQHYRWAGETGPFVVFERMADSK